MYLDPQVVHIEMTARHLRSTPIPLKFFEVGGFYDKQGLENAKYRNESTTHASVSKTCLVIYFERRRAKLWLWPSYVLGLTLAADRY